MPLIYTLSQGTPEQKALVREAIEQGGLDKIDQIVEAVRICGALNYTSSEPENSLRRPLPACRPCLTASIVTLWKTWHVLLWPEHSKH